jgi:tetratricopeptide (TPR) repeat protein
MVPESIVTRLIRLIYRAQEAEEDYLSTLSDGERTAQGTYQNWAPKDVIAHTNYWRKRCIEMLAYASREQEPPEYPDYEELNRENFEENRDINLEMHLRESRSIVKALDEVLHRFEDEDVTNPDRYPWRNGQPLISYIICNGYLHPISHLCQTYQKLGDQATAFQLQETAVKDVSEVDENPTSRGIAIYDLACFYTQLGDIDSAIQKLGEALKLSPNLAEWSKQDADLASLHNDPRYLQLLSK